MEKLETRNDIRINNQVQILNLLRQDRMTITDIAERLGMSFTAISNIVEEMIKNNIIRYVENKKTNLSRGRTPTLLEMNLDVGLVCGIDLSSKNIRIVLCTLDSNIIAEKIIQDALFIEQIHFEMIEKEIRELLKLPEVKNRKLVSICIASPGMIRPENFEYADVYRIPNFAKINPVVFFKNAFNVRTEMHNEIRISCLAELKFGGLANVKGCGAFLHIGTGSGIAIVYNDKIYKGSNGFSGETPSYSEKDEYSTNCWNNRIFSIWDIALKVSAMNGIKTDINYSPDVDELVKQYNEGNKTVVDVVDESCKRNAITIVGLSSILDIDTIVIEGSILKFGDSYLNKLKKYVIEYSNLEVRCNIIPSQTNTQCSILGVCYQGITSYLFESLEKMAQKRLSNPKYRINNSFKELY